MIERLLDSVIIIDHLNGLAKATRFLSHLDPSHTAVSVITRAEVLSGIEDQEEDYVFSLLDEYRLLIIDRVISDLSAKLRRIHGWKLPDAFQAALAKHHGVKLTTRNTKDFDPKDHRFVEIPYSL